ncbi:MAG: hypothetical protein AAGB04_13860 [Pseudomonadota bacterium]
MSQLRKFTEKDRPASKEVRSRSDRELLLDVRNRRLTWLLSGILIGVALFKSYVILLSR